MFLQVDEFFNTYLYADIIGKADYIVYFTDYENYGAIFRCQKVLFGHRRSATILSRYPYLSQSFRNQVRSHTDCTSSIRQSRHTQLAVSGFTGSRKTDKLQH